MCKLFPTRQEQINCISLSCDSQVRSNPMDGWMDEKTDMKKHTHKVSHSRKLDLLLGSTASLEGCVKAPTSKEEADDVDEDGVVNHSNSKCGRMCQSPNFKGGSGQSSVTPGLTVLWRSRKVGMPPKWAWRPACKVGMAPGPVSENRLENGMTFPTGLWVLNEL